MTSFGRSFICSDGARTSGRTRDTVDDVRFYVESVVRISDLGRGATRTFYQCGSCKAENTFDAKGPGDFFKQDNYDFLPVVCEQEIVVFRRWARSRSPYKTFSSPGATAFGSFAYHIREHTGAELASFAEISEATRNGIPIVGVTAITNSETGLRAEIEYPIKTMNIRYDPDMFQVDTGPVVLPDISLRHENWMEQVSLAYIAYGALVSADFIVEDEVPVLDGGREVCRVMHYAHTVALAARNSLWAIRDP